MFARARRSALHHAFATIGADGEAQVAPIGSLWLDPREPRGVYIDVFNRELAGNLDRARRVTILAVDARKRMWAAALLRGQFPVYPALRLSGSAGERRQATAAEAERFRRMFRPFRWTRGHRLLWRHVDTVREIRFDTVAPVRIGRMTRDVLDPTS